MRYFTATYLRKPGGQIDEEVAVHKKIKDADLSNCNVIVDFKDKKVIKCVIEGKVTPTDYNRMVSYYKTVYPKIIGQLEELHLDESGSISKK